MVLVVAVFCCHGDESPGPLQKLASFPEVEESSAVGPFVTNGQAVRMVCIDGVHRQSLVLSPGGSLQASAKGGALLFWVGAAAGGRLGKEVEASIEVMIEGPEGDRSRTSAAPVAGKWTRVEARLPAADAKNKITVKLDVPGDPGRAAGEEVAIGSARIARAFKKRNIIIISIDTLRADHLETYGYSRPTSPAISDFARESVVFERCYSHASWTPPSVASLFTSLYPTQHGSLGKDRIPLPEGNRTMAETFAKAGYYTAAFSSSPFVHPDFGFGQGFRVFGFDPTENAGALNNMVGKWLDERPPGPYLLYIMYFDPHFPYEPPAEYRNRFKKGPEGGTLWHSGHVPAIKSLFGLSAEVGRETYHYLHSSYEGEIAFTDDRLGALLSRLREEGLVENSIVVLTSDHGEEFLEHKGFGHGNTFYEEQLHVPLLVRLPAGRGGGRRIKAILRQVDLLPTLIEFASIEHEGPLEGKSFLHALTDQGPLQDRPAFATSMHLLHQGQTMRSLRAGDHKLIIYENPDRVLLFDLAADPEELRNLARKKPEIRERILTRLLALEESMTETSVETDNPSPARTRGLLESLGYVDN